jgi:hypothetical protein
MSTGPKPVHPFKLRPEFAQRIQNEIGGYISRAEIDDALALFARLVRPDHLHRTSELGNNPLSVVFTVLDRLAVCRRLRQHSPHPPLMLPFLDDPLVSYLYLTCFDRLGQPAGWMDFGVWLEACRCKDERDAAVKQASQAGNLVESMKIVYRQYVTLYGVRSAFFRFLHEVVPPDVRGELLHSIDRVIMTNPPDTTSRQASDDEKEKYLFRRRNDYTHKGDFRPPPGEWFGGGVTNPVQEHHATYWISTRTVGWPDILEKAVRTGLARYLLVPSKAVRQSSRRTESSLRN